MALQIPDQTIAEVPLNPHVDPMTRISGMLNIQQQRQGLQAGQIANESNQKILDERNAIRNLVNDPELRNPDGSWNQDKFTARAQVVAPTQGASVAQGNLSNQTTQISNDTNKFKLHGDYAQTALDTASGLLKDPRITADNDQYSDEKATEALIEAKKQMMLKGVPETQAEIAVAPFVNNVHTAGAVAKMLQNTVAGQLNAGQKVQSLQPNGPILNNGQTQQQYNTNQFAGPTGPVQGISVQNELPPSTQKFNPQTGQMEFIGSTAPSAATPSAMQISPDVQASRDSDRLQILTNELKNERDPNNIAALQREIMRTKNGMQNPQPANASQATRAPIAAGAPADYPELMGIRTAANQAFASVGDSRSNNAQIREVLQNTSGDYLDPTGKGAQALQNLSSKMGFTIAPDSASNYNSIAHNLALQQQTNNQRMGVKTDAGSAISGISSGNADQDRKTLMKAINISDAGNTGIELFNQGMESSIKSDGILSVRAFKNAWSNNYDVNALRLINAGQNKDKEESANVIKLLGGTDSMAYKKARQHAINMEMLSNGQLPKGSQ